MGRLALILALIAALVAAGAAFGANVRIGAKANGKRVTAHIGDHVLIHLATIPSTGYSWKLVSVNRSVLVPGGKTYVPNRPIRTGSGGTAWFKFGAAKRGSTQVKLAYVQAGSKRVGKRFSVIIAVG